jgi:hypothetical protein
LQTPYNVVVHITAIKGMGMAEDDTTAAYFSPTEEPL